MFMKFCLDGDSRRTSDSLLTARSATAVTRVWNGPATGGDFQDALNWSPSAVPQNNDFTIINSVNGTITHSSSTAVLSNSFYTGGNLHTVLDIGAGQTHTTTSLFRRFRRFESGRDRNQRYIERRDNTTYSGANP